MRQGFATDPADRQRTSGMLCLHRQGIRRRNRFTHPAVRLLRNGRKCDRSIIKQFSHPHMGVPREGKLLIAHQQKAAAEALQHGNVLFGNIHMQGMLQHLCTQILRPLLRDDLVAVVLHDIRNMNLPRHCKQRETVRKTPVIDLLRDRADIRSHIQDKPTGVLIGKLLHEREKLAGLGGLHTGRDDQLIAAQEAAVAAVLHEMHPGDQTVQIRGRRQQTELIL